MPVSVRLMAGFFVVYMKWAFTLLGHKSSLKSTGISTDWKPMSEHFIHSGNDTSLPQVTTKK